MFMHRLVPCLLPLVTLVAIASGCASSDEEAPTTTTPSAVTVTETFSGTLTLNGAATHPFDVTANGLVTALVKTLSPDAAQIIGVALGTWSGNACQIVLANDAATEGSSVTGTAAVAGSFCLRVSDARGTVATPASYVIDVTHP